MNPPDDESPSNALRGVGLLLAARSRQGFADGGPLLSHPPLRVGSDDVCRRQESHRVSAATLPPRRLLAWPQHRLGRCPESLPTSCWPPSVTPMVVRLVKHRVRSGLRHLRAALLHELDHALRVCGRCRSMAIPSSPECCVRSIIDCRCAWRSVSIRRVPSRAGPIRSGPVACRRSRRTLSVVVGLMSGPRSHCHCDDVDLSRRGLHWVKCEPLHTKTIRKSRWNV